jgi:hypothetical protein
MCWRAPPHHQISPKNQKWVEMRMHETNALHSIQNRFFEHFEFLYFISSHFKKTEPLQHYSNFNFEHLIINWTSQNVNTSPNVTMNAIGNVKTLKTSKCQNVKTSQNVTMNVIKNNSHKDLQHNFDKPTQGVENIRGRSGPGLPCGAENHLSF